MNRMLLLTINAKDNTLIVSKETLEALGSPEYVQLRMNEQNRTLALAPCAMEDTQALIVNTGHNMVYEIGAYNLIRRIRRLAGWEDEKSRVSFGIHLPEHNAVVFSLTAVQPAVLAAEARPP